MVIEFVFLSEVIDYNFFFSKSCLQIPLHGSILISFQSDLTLCRVRCVFTPVMIICVS